MPVLPPREFTRSVRDYIRAHELLAPGATVVVGVSGGPDSLALLYSLHELSTPLRLTLHVAHLDHQLRRGSGADAKFVKGQAVRLGWPCTAARAAVAWLAATRRCSLEEAGRLARYRLFFKLARRVRASHVAVGHHRDDQAETVLMRLLRGASASGLSGIAPKRRLMDPLAPIARRPNTGVWLIRPLLGSSRAEIEGFLAARRLCARRDPSNVKLDFLRNRIRHELLPLLERRYNPALRKALARAAQALEEDDAVLESLAEAVLRRAGVMGRRRVALNARGLNVAPLPVRRRALRLAAGRAGAALNRLTQTHLDALVILAAATKGETHLPGAIASRLGDTLVIKHVSHR